jgi:hypothetical protein
MHEGKAGSGIQKKKKKNPFAIDVPKCLIKSYHHIFFAFYFAELPTHLLSAFGQPVIRSAMHDSLDQLSRSLPAFVLAALTTRGFSS